ncbi:hypothetical protein F5Y11DRAFT_364403 [Daldinia sp. FL1419]|nr:hypothetical protein F5Y11DRAFT_364403 [Daldinia sp. FL1419]
MAVQTAPVANPSAVESPPVANPTTPPSVSVLTLTERQLTTTFTPPTSCGEMHLTQLSSPGYQLWLNEPQPVPNSKIGDCYPSGYINGYTSVCDRVYIIFPSMLLIVNASSSIAPMFSPLVCPEGWNTARTWPDGYIACCASGFQLHLPDQPVDTNRPAYGGTCYSNFRIGQTATVTAYDSGSITATVEWVASATNDQAYAHPIDGFALSALNNDSKSTGLSGGAIAGIVIGVLVGVIALLVGLLFFLRRQRQKKKKAQSPLDDAQQQQTSPPELSSIKEPATTPCPDYAQSQHTATSGMYAGPTPPYKPTEHYELDSQTPNELDSGWAGGELENHEVPAHRRT